jgi:hypothetical protein
LISNVTVDGKELYKQVLETLKPGRMQKTWCMSWCNQSRIFHWIRKIVPDSFLLVPGVEHREEVYLKYVNTEWMPMWITD